MIEGRQYQFGVSGLLYKSNLLLYDKQTGSLWSQLLSEAVTGALAGKHLAVLPAENTAWGTWRAAHPGTRVLSFFTGYARDYAEDPYAAYPLRRNAALLVAAEGQIKIYPFSELKKARSAVTDRVGGQELDIRYDRRTNTARIDNQPASVTAFVAFLDDLKAFYPQAGIYRAPHR